MPPCPPLAMPLMRDRAEVTILTIPYIILFRISCNSSALCSNFHALFSSTGKMPCKYGPVFALYLYRIESNHVNTMQNGSVFTRCFSCEDHCQNNPGALKMILYCKAWLYNYSIEVIIIQLTSLIMCWLFY